MHVAVLMIVLLYSSILHTCNLYVVQELPGLIPRICQVSLLKIFYTRLIF